MKINICGIPYKVKEVSAIDEAIKHAEEVVEGYKKKLKVYENIDEDKPLFTEEEMECRLCAEEHRQLAEWLKELKKLREIPDKLVPKYRDGIQDEYDRGANEMLEEVIDDIRKYIEEVKADENSN